LNPQQIDHLCAILAPYAVLFSADSIPTFGEYVELNRLAGARNGFHRTANFSIPTSIPTPPAWPNVAKRAGDAQGSFQDRARFTRKCMEALQEMHSLAKGPILHQHGSLRPLCRQSYLE
jgi:hypothetical protein